MNPIDRKKIEQTISLLQEVLGQKSGSSTGVSKITIPNFDAEVTNFTSLGEKGEPELKDLTHIFTDAIGLMQNILNYSAAAKPPTEGEKKSLQEKFMSLSKKT